MKEVNVNTIVDNMNMIEAAASAKRDIKRIDYGFWNNETLIVPTESGERIFSNVSGLSRSKTDKEFFYFLYDNDDKNNYKIGMLERDLNSEVWTVVE
ncbi:MAG: hypothetical protein IJ479_06345 [Alphaproteobacteria bacterium]|nr:hypothetical protein [Alphaproteobacteria bacterium]